MLVNLFATKASERHHAFDIYSGNQKELDSFYKTTENDDKIPLDLSYLTESNYSNKLENSAETLLQRFEDNRMKANPDNYHLLINNTKESFQIKLGNETVRTANIKSYWGLK